MTRDENVSRSIEKRPIALWHCPKCDFLWNKDFEEDLVTYDESYEGTQFYSGYFRSYISELANRWLSQLLQTPKNILEVGCGQGEFLEVLSKVISVPLVGYDPAYRGGAETIATVHNKVLPDVEIDRFDLVLNRMTLEHIGDPYQFMSAQARWLSPAGTLLTQVPNAARMVEEQLPCDLIYEHVNYFTANSLTALHSRIGLTDISTETDYDEQHLDSVARHNVNGPQSSGFTKSQAKPLDVKEFRKKALDFAANWQKRLDQIQEDCNALWIWGAGSRATTFLNFLSQQDRIAGVIDINPRREGTYVLGTSCKTHLPEHLRDQQGLGIVITNPIYLDEICAELERLNASATLYNLNGEEFLA